MAKLVLKNPSITVNAVDLSDHVDQVTLETTYAEVDQTAFGDTAMRRAAGLADSKVTIEFQQDFAAASVEETIYPLLGTTTAIQIWPDGGTTSSANPAYSFDALVNDWKPLDGKIGDQSKSSVTWPADGAIVKSTS